MVPLLQDWDNVTLRMEKAEQRCGQMANISCDDREGSRGMGKTPCVQIQCSMAVAIPQYTRCLVAPKSTAKRRLTKCLKM